MTSFLFRVLKDCFLNPSEGRRQRRLKATFFPKKKLSRKATEKSSSDFLKKGEKKLPFCPSFALVLVRFFCEKGTFVRARVNYIVIGRIEARTSRRPTTNATALAARRTDVSTRRLFSNSTFLRSSWAIRISSSSSSKSTRSTWRTRSPPNISTNRTKRLWRIAPCRCQTRRSKPTRRWQTRSSRSFRSAITICTDNRSRMEETPC